MGIVQGLKTFFGFKAKQTRPLTAKEIKLPKSNADLLHLYDNLGIRKVTRGFIEKQQNGTFKIIRLLQDKYDQQYIGQVILRPDGYVESERLIKQKTTTDLPAFERAQQERTLPEVPLTCDSLGWIFAYARPAEKDSIPYLLKSLEEIIDDLRKGTSSPTAGRQTQTAPA